MESYFRALAWSEMDWDNNIHPPIGVRIDISLYQWTVPYICFANYIDDDLKIILYARIKQLYADVFLNGIEALRHNFTGDARELAQSVLMEQAFWNQFQKGRDALSKKYNIKIDYRFDNNPPDEKKIEAQMKERQSEFIHSRLARICPWCQKYFIPTGPQGYKQIYCHSECKEKAKYRRKYLRGKSTLTKKDKMELERLTVQPETPTKFEYEAKIRKILRQLGFPDNSGWTSCYKAKEVELLEEQFKINNNSTPSK